MTDRRAVALAHSNIALAKYWGKLDTTENLPATPSLSLTLDGLTTRTEVRFHPSLARDEGTLDGRVLEGEPLRRVSALLDRARALAGSELRARVDSANDFPTAAGLASSASGFAALALAATRALGLELSTGAVSALARASSASAARSLYGGFAALGAGAREAEAVAPADHWDLRLLVVVTVKGPKAIGSTAGMQHTARTSPYYPAWVASAPSVYERVRRAVLARDLEALGTAMEHSALLMHASMLGADPAIVYFAPVTLAVLAALRELRAAGTLAYGTMDAGPHVKVLCAATEAARVTEALAGVSGVDRVIACAPGPAARVIEVG
jgi:diphosphomevalonate decarboxylase